MIRIKENIKKLIPDKVYLKRLYKKILGENLNVNNPKTFNEKLQWLKLNDRKDIYTTMVDKYEAKKYVADIIGKEYIIPTLGIYDKFEDIDFEKLPNQFVLKCTHDSGSTVICQDKERLNIDEIKKKIKKELKHNFYYNFREWPYKNVKPRIIIEEYMINCDNTDICDYKFYCFNGKCEYVMVCTERQKGKTKFYFFDKEWRLQRNMSNDGKNSKENFYLEKPRNLEDMFSIAEQLSEGIKFVRVDLYNIDNKIYFSEITFYPSAGFDSRRTLECDKILSSKLKLF